MVGVLSGLRKTRRSSWGMTVSWVSKLACSRRFVAEREGTYSTARTAGLAAGRDRGGTLGAGAVHLEVGGIVLRRLSMSFR